MFYFIDVPIFNNESVYVTKMLGDMFQLSLNVSALPPVTASQWMRDGQVVEPSDGYSLGLLNITISKLDRVDNKQWSVNVTNGIGFSVYTFTLNVLCKLRM